MQTIGERIKELRLSQEPRMSQEQFARRIGATPTVISRYEAGLREVPSTVIHSVCREFNVNREWLVNGRGEMTVPTASKTLDEVARRYSESRTFRAILDVYAELDDASRIMFERYIERLTEVLATGGDTTKVTVDPDEVSVLEKAQQGATVTPKKAEPLPDGKAQ